MTTSRARSIYWLEDLDLACSLVKRTIEQMRADASDDLGAGHLLKPPAEEKEFVTRRSTADRSTRARSTRRRSPPRPSNWEADRIAVSDMILMKMALTEARELRARSP